MDIARIFGVSDEEIKKVENKISNVGNMAAKGLISDSQLFEKISKILGKPLPEKGADMAQKFCIDNFVFLPGTIDLVKKIKALGIKTAVLSNVSKFGADVIREKNGYDDFDKVVLSYEVGLRKPEPEIYVLAAKKLNVQPEECIFIDDYEGNLEPAEKLGMKTVLFKTPKQAIKEVLAIINK